MWENKEEFLNQKIEVIEPVFEGTKTYILDDMLQHVGEKETVAFLLKNQNQNPNQNPNHKEIIENIMKLEMSLMINITESAGYKVTCAIREPKIKHRDENSRQRYQIHKPKRKPKATKF